MPDIVDPETRSRMMSNIRGKDTKPELLIRHALHAKGLRYRLHVKDIPGRPDMVFPRFRAVVFVHGCFWHGHNCSLFRLPDTRAEFWKVKIERNKKRDKEVATMLSENGWRYLVVWECATRGRGQLPFDTVVGQVTDWIRSSEDTLEIRGKS
ncbi:MAG: very short patch repair endonuclease [Gammaproteobacteria bacterium]|nr:very short patch repair endonuclease [Gammaproteobacteria bacterium]